MPVFDVGCWVHLWSRATNHSHNCYPSHLSTIDKIASPSSLLVSRLMPVPCALSRRRRIMMMMTSTRRFVYVAVDFIACPMCVVEWSRNLCQTSCKDLKTWADDMFWKYFPLKKQNVGRYLKKTCSYFYFFIFIYWIFYCGHRIFWSSEQCCFNLVPLIN
jgi:hypothetical protein